jgi:hypothetical protein
MPSGPGPAAPLVCGWADGLAWSGAAVQNWAAGQSDRQPRRVACGFGSRRSEAAARWRARWRSTGRSLARSSAGRRSCLPSTGEVSAATSQLCRDRRHGVVRQRPARQGGHPALVCGRRRHRPRRVVDRGRSSRAGWVGPTRVASLGWPAVRPAELLVGSTGRKRHGRRRRPGRRGRRGGVGSAVGSQGNGEFVVMPQARPGCGLRLSARSGCGARSAASLTAGRVGRGRWWTRRRGRPERRR